MILIPAPRSWAWTAASRGGEGEGESMRRSLLAPGAGCKDPAPSKAGGEYLVARALVLKDRARSERERGRLWMALTWRKPERAYRSEYPGQSPSLAFGARCEK